MHNVLKNPFDTCATPVAPVEAAACSDALDHAAVDLAESSMTKGGTQEAPAVAASNTMTAGLFDGPDIPLAELVSCGFNVEAFLKKIAPDIEHDPSPLLLAAPSQEYLKASDLMPVLQALAGH